MHTFLSSRSVDLLSGAASGFPSEDEAASVQERAGKKLRADELLLTGFAATRLRMELDRVPLWRGDHVSVK